jgi:hypothetical protein
MFEKILDIDDYVKQTALILDLTLPPEYLPDVVDQIGRIATIAQLVLDFPLESDLDPASTFQP